MKTYTLHPIFRGSCFIVSGDFLHVYGQGSKAASNALALASLPEPPAVLQSASQGALEAANEALSKPGSLGSAHVHVEAALKGLEGRAALLVQGRVVVGGWLTARIPVRGSTVEAEEIEIEKIRIAQGNHLKLESDLSKIEKILNHISNGYDLELAAKLESVSDKQALELLTATTEVRL